MPRPEESVQRLADLLERRASALRRVSRELERGNRALVSLQLDAAGECQSSVAILSGEARFLLQEMDRIRQQFRGQYGVDPLDSPLQALREQFSPALVERLMTSLREHENARLQVQHLNRVRAAFLRRARRSVNVMMNFFGSCGPTYRPPRSQSETKGVQAVG